MDRRGFNTALLASSVSGFFASPALAGQNSAGSARLVIGMLVHSDMILLDLVGPLTVFSMLQADVRLIARTAEPVRTDVGILVAPNSTFGAAPENLDVLFVPGGLKGTLSAMQDQPTLEFLKLVGERSRFVTSVCTGSLLLGAAGLLRDYRATSHWYVRDQLPLMGATLQKDRVVQDRNRITAGGVTAGIDFGLTVAAALVGEEQAKRIQLLIEYNPKPPFSAGSPEEAGQALSEDALRRRDGIIRQVEQVTRAAGARLGI